MNDIFDYDVFISFSNLDTDIVKPIWQEMMLQQKTVHKVKLGYFF